MSPTTLDEVSTFSACSLEAPAALNRFGMSGHMQISVSEESTEAYPPEAVQVRNTFIHVASPSAPEDANRPAVVSCPASHIGCMLESLFEEEDEEPPRSKPVICLEDALFDAAPGTPEPYTSLAPLSTLPVDYSETKPWQLPLGPLAGQSYSQITHTVGASLGPIGQTVGPSLTPTSTGPSVGTIGPSAPLHSHPVTSPAQSFSKAQVQNLSPSGPIGPHPAGAGLGPAAPAGLGPGLGPVGAPVARAHVGVPVSDVPMVPPSVPAPFEPAPGSMELPSIGSKGHYVGDCRPCAFLHAKGCNNGAMCQFCHLCDRGEKKRRQKAKKASFRGGA